MPALLVPIGFYLDTSTCTKCDDGCISCTGSDNCNECSDGYFKVFNSRRCEKCPPSCKTCTSTNQCKACVDGYHGLICNNACMDLCSNCVKATGACDVCKAGFYGGSCTNSCSEGCGVNDDEMKWCRKENGVCQYGCLTGFTGKTCSETLSSGLEHTNAGTIVGLIIGSIGCVALIVLVVVAVLILRRKTYICQKSESHEDSNQQGHTENEDPTLSQYEDICYRPGNDTLYSHLGIYSNTGEENAIRPQYDNVQERVVNETNALKTLGYKIYVTT